MGWLGFMMGLQLLRALESHPTRSSWSSCPIWGKVVAISKPDQQVSHQWNWLKSREKNRSFCRLCSAVLRFNQHWDCMFHAGVNKKQKIAYWGTKGSTLSLFTACFRDAYGSTCPTSPGKELSFSVRDEDWSFVFVSSTPIPRFMLHTT